LAKRAKSPSVDTNGLPPLLAKLLAPWLDAIEASEPGMGDHIRAIASHCSDALRRRVELTLPLERAFDTALVTTDAVAAALDAKRSVPSRIRSPARTALADLIGALRDAVPNAVTRELGLGW
jgi:hypothetical protein